MKIQDHKVDRLIDTDITVDLDHHDIEIGIETEIGIEIGIGIGIEIGTEIENLDQEADLDGEGNFTCIYFTIYIMYLQYILCIILQTLL